MRKLTENRPAPHDHKLDQGAQRVEDYVPSPAVQAAIDRFRQAREDIAAGRRKPPKLTPGQRAVVDHMIYG